MKAPRKTVRTNRPRSDPAIAAPRKGQLRLHAVEELRKRILSGELPPGARLREIALSKELGMSRTPVREAFHALAAEGLVDLLPNRSVVVSVLDKSEAADVFAVLGALEALAGQLACRRMSAEEIGILGELQEDLATYFARGERLNYLQANHLIHEFIVEGSKSPSLIMVWRLLLPRAERARKLSTLDHERWADAFAEHGEIYEALSRRDEQRLHALMESHFLNGANSLRNEQALDRARIRQRRYAKASLDAKAALESDAVATAVNP